MKLKSTYIFFIFVCILSGSFNSFSQQRKIDSLLKILPLRKDSARVKVLLKLASGYKRVSLDTAINYANVALNESQKINHTRYEYDAVFKLGDLYREKGEFALSLKFLT